MFCLYTGVVYLQCRLNQCYLQYINKNLQRLNSLQLILARDLGIIVEFFFIKQMSYPVEILQKKESD